MFLKNILTSYQLENYDNSRFLKFIYSHPKFWFFWWERQNIVWTKKAIILTFFTIILAIWDLSLIFYIFKDFLNVFSIIIIVFLIIFFLPIYMIIANFLLLPLDRYLKKRIISEAKDKLKSFKNLKIIWITWSYWKTSQKDILEAILKDKYKVLTTDWNKNTPLWISELIINKLDETYEIFIVEMWAYYKWDIKELCNLVNPSIGILTWITYQHLERFWSLENIIDTKFELIESLDLNWLGILDISNENVEKWLLKKQDKFEVNNIIKINSPENIKYLENLSWISFNYDWNTFETKLLASHSANQIIIAYEVAKYLGMSSAEILKEIKKIDYTKHRLELIYNPNTNIYIIDDSYNWNLEWVKSTVKLLENIKWHRKLYLTPWLVELWDKTDEVHYEIWKMLFGVIDKALLIDNKSTKKIYSWLVDSWFVEDNIKVYNSTSDAHSDLKNVLNSWDIIVFQNDWSDNYF